MRIFYYCRHSVILSFCFILLTIVFTGCKTTNLHNTSSLREADSDDFKDFKCNDEEENLYTPGFASFKGNVGYLINIRFCQKFKTTNVSNSIAVITAPDGTKTKIGHEDITFVFDPDFEGELIKSFSFPLQQKTVLLEYFQNTSSGEKPQYSHSHSFIFYMFSITEATEAGSSKKEEDLFYQTSGFNRCPTGTDGPYTDTLYLSQNQDVKVEREFCRSDPRWGNQTAQYVFLKIDFSKIPSEIAKNYGIKTSYAMHEISVHSGHHNWYDVIKLPGNIVMSHHYEIPEELTPSTTTHQTPIGPMYHLLCTGPFQENGTCCPKGSTEGTCGQSPNSNNLHMSFTRRCRDAAPERACAPYDEETINRENMPFDLRSRYFCLDGQWKCYEEHFSKPLFYPIRVRPIGDKCSVEIQKFGYSGYIWDCAEDAYCKPKSAGWGLGVCEKKD